MTNDARRTSQLGIATTLSANDRVVVLTNPATSAQTQTISVYNFANSIANSIPIANATSLGVFKVGPGLAMASNGVLSAPIPLANTTSPGVVQPDGNTILIDSNGMISANLSPSNQLVNGSYIVNLNAGGDTSFPGSIVPTTNVSYSLGNTTNYWNSIYSNSISVPNGSLITSTLLVSPVINNANLDHIVAYSTDSTSIPIGTYGNANEIPAPWSVYQLTAVPSPVLQVNDLVAGTGVPLNNHIAFIGSGTYANLIIANTTFTVAPPANGTLLTITRDVINPSFSITTIDNTNIALTPGSNGIIVVNSDIVPVITDTNRLGTPAKRFKELWLGPGTLYVADETLGVDQALGAKDGNFYIKGGAGFNVGEFTFRDNQIAITDPARDIQFGTTLATGNVVFNRPIAVKTYDTGKTSFSVSRAGLVNIVTPSTILTTQAALSITGASSEVSQPRNFTGTLLQGTAQDGQPARVGFDAFGANTYVAIAGRGARGTVQAPSGTQANDTIMRLSMQGWTTDGNTYAGSIGRINMLAAENFYTANTGTKITFQLTPAGSNSIQSETVSFTSNGMSFVNNPNSGIQFSDGSVQNTAFNSTSAVTEINVGTGLTQTSNVGIVGIDSQAVLSVAGTANQISVSNVGGNYTLSLPQSIGTNSTVQFNTLTVTNLNVTGGTTTANSLSIADKLIHLAPNTSSSSQIDGGGITLGNTSSDYTRSILYNLANDRWDTDGSGFKTLNLVSENIVANSGIFNQQLHIGAAYQGFDYPNADLQIDCNINSYNQIVQQNHNNGTQASVDYVAVNDIGTDSNNYIDMGINSSTYTNTFYSMTGPNDGYFYVNGGDLSIATQTAGKVIKFYTGNTTTDTLRATINTIGLSVVGNVYATNFVGNVTGNISGSANSAAFIGTLPAANVVSNSQLQSNLANYTTTASLTANLDNYQTSAGLSANVLNLTSNVANYIIANTGLISNSSGVFVNSAYIVSVASGADNDSGYQTTAGLAANVLTLTSNSSNYVGSISAANVVSNAQLQSNLTNYAALSGASFTNNVSVANTLTVAKLSANGTLGTAAQVLASNGTATYWTTQVQSIAGANNIVLSGSTGAVTINRVDGFQSVVTGLNTTPYNVLTTDQYIGSIRAATSSSSIVLPLGSTLSPGRVFNIKDESGHAHDPGRAITISRSDSDLIDGATSTTINSNYGSVTLTWTGTTWSLI